MTGGKAQASALGGIAIPIYFPRLLATGSSYCSGTIGNCPAEIATTGSYPRAYLIHGSERRDPRLLPDDGRARPVER